MAEPVPETLRRTPETVPGTAPGALPATSPRPAPGATVVHLPAPAETALLVGFDPADAGRLAGALREAGVALRTAGDGAEALALLARREAGVLCLGPGVAGRVALELLRQAIAAETGPPRCHVVLAAGPDPGIFQELIDRDRLFYLSREPLPPADLAGLLRAAVDRYRRALAPPPAAATATAARVPDAAAGPPAIVLLRELARETDPGRAAALLARAARRTVEAGRVLCVLHDPAAETFFEPAPGPGEHSPGGDEPAESTASGAIGFALRTGRAVRIERLEEDPRCDPDADRRGGPPGQRLLAVPVTPPESSLPWGALVALRDPAGPPFEAADEERLVRLAERAAPFCALLAPAGGPGGGAEGEEAPALFRREALDFHLREAGVHGRPLELSPAWARRVFQLVLALFAAALVFAAFGSLDEYAAGPAVVRFEGADEITARAAGTVTEVAVEPGQAVAAGDLLLRLDDGAEAAEAERVERELEAALLQRLRDPADRGSETLLHALRARREEVRARLDLRAVRAPRAGTVGELRARPGQRVAPGDILLSLAGERAERTLVVLFPSHQRPRLVPGMELRLEIDGYPRAYQTLVLDRVGDAAIGPAEARRVLGGAIGDAVPLAAPVVVGHARLPSETFAAGGRSYPYHEGLAGRAEARIGSRRILAALIPGFDSREP